MSCVQYNNFALHPLP